MNNPVMDAAVVLMNYIPAQTLEHAALDRLLSVIRSETLRHDLDILISGGPIDEAAYLNDPTYHAIVEVWRRAGGSTFHAGYHDNIRTPEEIPEGTEPKP